MKSGVLLSFSPSRLAGHACKAKIRSSPWGTKGSFPLAGMNAKSPCTFLHLASRLEALRPQGVAKSAGFEGHVVSLLCISDVERCTHHQARHTMAMLLGNLGCQIKHKMNQY